MAGVEGSCHVSNEALVQLAIEARNHAYVPYSHYAVGAALLCSDGTVYGGANLENAAYTPSNCAERTAFFRAVFEGRRDFVAIAVVGGPEGEAPTAWCTPCGVCRQVIREWCDPATFRIVLGKADAAPREYLLQDILPMGFGPEDLGESSPAGASCDDAVKGAAGGHEHGCGCGCGEHGAGGHEHGTGGHGCGCGCGEHGASNQ